MWRIIFLFLKAFLLVTLPFILLIRGAIFLHLFSGLNAWVALFCSAMGTAFLLLLYIRFALKRFLGVKQLSRAMRRIQYLLIVSMVLFYTGYGVINFSKNNAKSERQHSEFRKLHPHLRIAISTVIFLDMNLVVTDMGRKKLDYRLMGLPPKERSMHYVQPDGYIHAIDLRTQNRSELRNLLVRGYFMLMGFGTLRHSGTADHLHISIPTQENLHAL